LIDFEGHFWTLKRLFPGDPDFSVEKYSNLCYGYVLRAVSAGQKSRLRTLHEEERPIASLTSLTANVNRDSKKQRKPYSLDQFCLYQLQEDKNLPSYVYGSAAISAHKLKMLPNWALFCFKDLASTASKEYEPSNPVLLAEDALLLHPVKGPNGWKGLLIAQESASGKVRTFRNVDGEKFELAVPIIETKVVAIEGVTLS